MDNITIAQEMIHLLNGRKGGNGGLILKVDLEKAYNRVDWSFLDEMLSVTRFNSTLVELIRTCTISASLTVSRNGALLELFTPSRGLRQGDPRICSYYVWKYLVNGYHKLWIRENGQWSNQREEARPYPIFYLPTIYYSLGKLHSPKLGLWKTYLLSFVLFWGQRVSRNKSRVWFSSNTPFYLQHFICLAFQIPATTDLGTYLGVPLIHGRTWTTHFQYVLEKAHRKLAGWKLKSLSQAARLVLIKSTLATLPIYSMQAIRLPSSIV